MLLLKLQPPSSHSQAPAWACTCLGSSASPTLKPKRSQYKVTKPGGYFMTATFVEWFQESPEHWRYSSARHCPLDEPSVLEIDMDYE